MSGELDNLIVGVTGATGFLGRHIVDALLARGARVVGVVRNPGRVPELIERGVEMRRADLLEPASLARAFTGLDVLVSNAALFSVYAYDWERYKATNIEGTRNVFEAAAAAGVERVVHVSSIAVYRRGLFTPRPIDEPWPKLTERDLNPFNAYYVSKAISEVLAWELADRHELSLTCVRPGPIYGAHDPNATPLLARLFAAPLAIAPAWMRLPFVYAGDVADAIARAIARPEVAAGRAYNVAGDGDRTLREFAEAWRVAGGRISPLSLPLPVPVTYRIDNSRAYDELGWWNRPFVDGLRETFARQPEFLR